MSRTNGHKRPRVKLPKMVDKRTGWFGEGCVGPKGRKFIKRLCRRHNRHARFY